MRATLKDNTTICNRALSEFLAALALRKAGLWRGNHFNSFHGPSGRTIPAVESMVHLPMDMKVKIPGRSKLSKIVGIGPAGALISILLLAIFGWADSILQLSIAGGHSGVIKTIGMVLVILGLGLHLEISTWIMRGERVGFSRDD